jgi:ribosomal protein L11 methyltransferase
MLEGLHPNDPTHVARIMTDEARAKRIADLVGESFDPAETAIAAFESGNDAPSDDWLVEIFFRREPDREAVTRLVAVAAGGALPVDFAEFGTKDWVAASLEGLKPVRAGRFTIHGRHDRDKVAAAAIGLEIEAALAFGTGHHGTTRGCLLALDALLKARRPRRILDLGTGTGVLAIAAARALHRPVIATDIDLEAVGVARANARRNKACGLVRVVHARGTVARAIGQGGPYDLVLANILAGPLVRLAAPVARLLAPGATVILSGLLHAQANGVQSAYRVAGLRLRARLRLDEWTTLVLTKPPRRSRPTDRAPP